MWEEDFEFAQKPTRNPAHAGLGLKFIFFFPPFFVGEFHTDFISLAEACIVCGSCACPQGGAGTHRALEVQCPDHEVQCPDHRLCPLLGKSPFTKMFSACFQLQGGEGNSEHDLKHPGTYLATVPLWFALL